MNFGKATIVHAEEEPTKKIKFWLDALNNTNIDEESKKMLNWCLQNEIEVYRNPVTIMKMD